MKTITAPWDYSKNEIVTTAQIAAANAQIDRNMAICELTRGTIITQYSHPQYNKIMREYKKLLAQYRNDHADYSGLEDYKFALAEIEKKWSK